MRSPDEDKLFQAAVEAARAVEAKPLAALPLAPPLWSDPDPDPVVTYVAAVFDEPDGLWT